MEVAVIVTKPKNVARNPVARAVAKKQLKDAMLNMRIALLMMDDGDDVRDHILTISDSVFVVAESYALMGQEDSPEYRKLKSCMKVLTDCSERGFKWKTEWAITVDNAIDICSENWTKIPSVTFQQAMKNILG